MITLTTSIAIAHPSALSCSSSFCPHSFYQKAANATAHLHTGRGTMISEQCIVTTRPHTSLFAPRHATINTQNDNNNTTAKTTTAGTNKQRKTLHNYAIWLGANLTLIPWILWTIFGDLSADLARAIDWLTSFFSQIKRRGGKIDKDKAMEMENRNKKNYEPRTRSKIMNVINS